MPAQGLLFGMMLLGTIILGCASVIEGPLLPMQDWTYSSWMLIAYLAIFPSFIAALCWNIGIARAGANVAGIFINLMPIFAALLGLLFLDDPLGSYHVIGSGLVLLGLLTSLGLLQKLTHLKSAKDKEL